eukprot:GEMP01052022.1.p1 GENE.GEMP01052022.1~~GEMP01052022.1.p1  ORF type:complete len:103 (-),score=7.38 GEMP01052022.1:854-1162(-)
MAAKKDRLVPNSRQKIDECGREKRLISPRHPIYTSLLALFPDNNKNSIFIAPTHLLHKKTPRADLRESTSTVKNDYGAQITVSFLAMMTSFGLLSFLEKNDK